MDLALDKLSPNLALVPFSNQPKYLRMIGPGVLEAIGHTQTNMQTNMQTNTHYRELW